MRQRPEQLLAEVAFVKERNVSPAMGTAAGVSGNEAPTGGIEGRHRDLLRQKPCRPIVQQESSARGHPTVDGGLHRRSILQDVVHGSAVPRVSTHLKQTGHSSAHWGRRATFTLP